MQRRPAPTLPQCTSPSSSREAIRRKILDRYASSTGMPGGSIAWWDLWQMTSPYQRIAAQRRMFLWRSSQVESFLDLGTEPKSSPSRENIRSRNRIPFPEPYNIQLFDWSSWTYQRRSPSMEEELSTEQDMRSPKRGLYDRDQSEYNPSSCDRERHKLNLAALQVTHLFPQVWEFLIQQIPIHGCHPLLAP